MNEQRIVEVFYIKTSLVALWDALTNPDVTQRYWFDTRIESTWEVGSPIKYIRKGELTDEHVVLAIDKHHSLSHTFHPVFGEFQNEPASKVVFTMEESGRVVRLTVVHDGFPPNSKVYPSCCEGWPMILSNLKTLLETGSPLPEFTFPLPSTRAQ